MNKLNKTIANLITINDGLEATNLNLTNAMKQLVNVGVVIGDEYDDGTAPDAEPTIQEQMDAISYLNQSPNLLGANFAAAQESLSQAHALVTLYNTAIPIID